MAKSTSAKKTSRGRKSNNHEPMRKKLVEQQEKILSLYEHDLKVGQQASDEGTEDIVDRANNSYNREFMFALSDTERQTLVEIDRALQRIDAGDYGSCANCNEDIARARLRAVPWAKYCVDCQELAEQGALLES